MSLRDRLQGVYELVVSIGDEIAAEFYHPHTVEEMILYANIVRDLKEVAGILSTWTLESL
jgi:hypothetical protein